MRVAIAGAGGLLGGAVSRALITRGDEVVRLVRRAPTKAEERQWFPEVGRLPKPGLHDVDAVINFCGAGIADRPWTPGRKRELFSSRLGPTRTLAAALDGDGRCQLLLNASAIGIYGDRGDEILDEASSRGTGFLADLVDDWEAAARAASVPVSLLRTGHVLTASGGYLGKQKPLVLAGMGGGVGPGDQYQSWISVDDYVAAILFLVDRHLAGPFDLTAPNPVRNRELFAAYARRLGRPVIASLPTFPLRFVLGSDAVEELLLASQRVLPTRLLEAGFSFTHPELDAALAAL